MQMYEVDRSHYINSSDHPILTSHTRPATRSALSLSLSLSLYSITRGRVSNIHGLEVSLPQQHTAVRAAIHDGLAGPVDHICRHGTAGGRLLQQHMPARGGNRPGGDGGDPQGGADARRPAPQAPLPRLLRQGLRRVGADRLHQWQRRGEGRAAEPESPRVRLRAEDQGQARGRLPGHRLLRRRPHAHGPRRRRPRQGPLLAGRARQEGRQGVHRQRHQAAPAAHLQLHPARPDVRRKGPRRQGHRRTLRRAHAWHGALPGVHGPAVQLHRRRQRRRRGPGAGQGVPGEAEGQVPEPRRQHHARRDGPWQRPHLRRRLLPPRRQAPGPLPLRLLPPRQPIHQGLRRATGHRPLRRRVLPRLRRVHGQDGQHRRAHRRAGGDQEQVLPRQLIKIVLVLVFLLIELVRRLVPG